MELFLDGIKKGKLPPLKTPKELEYYILGADNTETNFSRNGKYNTISPLTKNSLPQQTNRETLEYINMQIN